MTVRLLPKHLILTAVLTGLITFSPGCSIGPDTKPMSGAPSMSEEDEIELGRQTTAFWVGNRPTLLVDNPTALRLDAMVQSLVPYSDRPNLLYHTIVINDPQEVNAYAAPGGFVFVTTGLLDLLDTPDELALTLGHELGHVSGLHGIRHLQDKKNAQVAVHIVSVLAYYGGGMAGAYAGTSVPTGYQSSALPGQISQLTQQTVQLLANVSALRIVRTAINGYGREREKQADRLGMTYIKRQGKYDPAAAITLFRRFDMLEQQVGKTKEDKAVLHSLVTCLNAHPEPEERVKQAKKQLSKMNIESEGKWLADRSLPDTLVQKQGPATVGPEILPVPADEAWFALCRWATVSPKIELVRKVARPTGRHMWLKAAGRGGRRTLEFKVSPADPAGAEVTVSASSENHDWWPTIAFKALEAELGLADYRCLEDILPASKPLCENCLCVSGTQQAVYTCLRSHMPWRLEFDDQGLEILRYRVAEGKMYVSVSIVISPADGESCRVYVHQGPMVGPRNQAAKFVFDLLEKYGHVPVKGSESQQ